MPTTPDLGITHYTPNQANPDVTGNAGMDGLDLAISGTAVIDCTAGGSMATTATNADGYVNWLHGRLKLTGTPGAGFNLIVPLANPKFYVIDNQSGQTATVKGATGTGIAVATGNIQIVYCDGTNVIAINLPSSSGTTTTTGLTGGAQSTLSGTTTGSAVSSQPFQAPTYKKVIVFFSAYENTTGTPQTITFPVAFAQTPVFTANSDPACTVSTTTLTLPASMGATMTGWVILEGY